MEDTKITVEESADLGHALLEAGLKAQAHPDNENVNVYVCETCGREDRCTEEEAYQAGWDYPPFIGLWTVVSPRPCPNCVIDTTAYWFLLNRKADDSTPIPERHMATLKRILAEEGPVRATS